MALLVSIFTTTTTTTPMPKMSLVVKHNLMAFIKDEPSAGRLNQELLPQDQSVKERTWLQKGRKHGHCGRQREKKEVGHFIVSIRPSSA